MTSLPTIGPAVANVRTTNRHINSSGYIIAANILKTITMQNSKKDSNQQTQVKKGDHPADQANDDMQRKDKKNNDQQTNAKHQDASKDPSTKDHSTKHTSSEDKSGAKNAQRK